METVIYQGGLPDFAQTELFGSILTVFFVLMGIAIFLTLRGNRYFKPAVLLLIAVYFLVLTLTYSPFVTFSVKYNSTTNTTALYLSNTGTAYGTILFSVSIALLVIALFYFFYTVVTSMGFGQGGSDIDVV